MVKETRPSSDEKENEGQLAKLTEQSSVVIGDYLYIFGGIESTHSRSNKLYRYNLASDRLELVPVTGTPPKRGSCHTAVAYQGCLYIYGGWDPAQSEPNQCSNSLFQFNPLLRIWREVTQHGPIPSKRRAHKVIVQGDNMWLFGGFSNKPEKDLFCFNFTTSTWTEIDTTGEAPGGRSRFGMAYYADQIFIFGGFDGKLFLSELYCLNLVTRHWAKIANNFPHPLGQFSVEVYNNILLIFGGNDGLIANNNFYGLFLDKQ